MVYTAEGEVAGRGMMDCGDVIPGAYSYSSPQLLAGLLKVYLNNYILLNTGQVISQLYTHC